MVPLCRPKHNTRNHILSWEPEISGRRPSSSVVYLRWCDMVPLCRTEHDIRAHMLNYPLILQRPQGFGAYEARQGICQKFMIMICLVSHSWCTPRWPFYRWESSHVEVIQDALVQCGRFPGRTRYHREFSSFWRASIFWFFITTSVTSQIVMPRK